MAVDLQNRRILADAIDDFIDGTIDNWTLDDIGWGDRNDTMCREIRRQTWLFYDDIRRYYNTGPGALGGQAEAILRRWSQLLRSDVEWGEVTGIAERRNSWTTLRAFFSKRATPRPAWKRNVFWPFHSRAHWEMFRDGNKTF
jgi:hypothetical protein